MLDNFLCDNHKGFGMFWEANHCLGIFEDDPGVAILLYFKTESYILVSWAYLNILKHNFLLRVYEIHPIHAHLQLSAHFTKDCIKINGAIAYSRFTNDMQRFSVNFSKTIKPTVLLIMLGCDGISDHASWNEVFHYWDTKLSCLTMNGPGQTILGCGSEKRI